MGDYFAGEPVRFDGVRLDLDWCTPFQHALVDRRPRSAARRNGHSELAALAGRPNAARAAGTFCAQNRFRTCRSLSASSRLPAWAHWVARPRLQASAARARGRMPLSEDLRNELAAIAPRKDCDVLAELSGLAHRRHRPPAGRAAHAVHFDVASSAVARRGFSLLRRFEIDSEIRTYTQRAFSKPTRYQLHVRRRSRAAGPVRGRHPLRPARAARASRRRVSSPAVAAGARTSRRTPRAGSLSGPRSRTPRDPFRRHGAQFLAETVAREDVELSILDRGRHAAAYVKGADAIAGAPALAGAGDPRPRLRGAGGRRGHESRATVSPRRPRQSRPYEPRGARADHRRPRLRRTGRLERLPDPLRKVAELGYGIRRSRSASSLSNAAGRRARRPCTGVCGNS